MTQDPPERPSLAGCLTSRRRWPGAGAAALQPPAGQGRRSAVLVLFGHGAPDAGRGRGGAEPGCGGGSTRPPTTTRTCCLSSAGRGCAGTEGSPPFPAAPSIPRRRPGRGGAARGRRRGGPGPFRGGRARHRARALHRPQRLPGRAGRRLVAQAGRDQARRPRRGGGRGQGPHRRVRRPGNRLVVGIPPAGAARPSGSAGCWCGALPPPWSACCLPSAAGSGRGTPAGYEDLPPRRSRPPPFLTPATGMPRRHIRLTTCRVTSWT